MSICLVSAQSRYYWIFLDITSELAYNGCGNVVRQIKICKPTIKSHMCMYKRLIWKHNDLIRRFNYPSFHQKGYSCSGGINPDFGSLGHWRTWFDSFNSPFCFHLGLFLYFKFTTHNDLIRRFNYLSFQEGFGCSDGVNPDLETRGPWFNPS